MQELIDGGLYIVLTLGAAGSVAFIVMAFLFRWAFNKSVADYRREREEEMREEDRP